MLRQIVLSLGLIPLVFHVLIVQTICPFVKSFCRFNNINPTVGEGRPLGLSQEQAENLIKQMMWLADRTGWVRWPGKEAFPQVS